MLFVILGALAVIFGFVGIIFAIGGEKDSLKKFVGTDNRGLAAVIGIALMVIGSAMTFFFLR
jgi:hypothetical protein